MMSTTDEPITGASGGAAESGASPETSDRRRPTLAHFTFEPDPRRLRALLHDVSDALEASDPLLQHKVRLLIGEIVARLLHRCPEATVQLDLAILADSVRVDVVETNGECDFWEGLDEAVFTDLTSGWGRDRRGKGGAWFEISAPGQAHQRTAAG